MAFYIGATIVGTADLATDFIILCLIRVAVSRTQELRIAYIPTLTESRYSRYIKKYLHQVLLICARFSCLKVLAAEKSAKKL